MDRRFEVHWRGVSRTLLLVTSTLHTTSPQFVQVNAKLFCTEKTRALLRRSTAYGIRQMGTVDALHPNDIASNEEADRTADEYI